MKVKLLKFVTVIRLLALLAAVMGAGALIHSTAQAADHKPKTAETQKSEKDDDQNEHEGNDEEEDD